MLEIIAIIHKKNELQIDVLRTIDFLRVAFGNFGSTCSWLGSEASMQLLFHSFKTEETHPNRQKFLRYK